MMRNSSWRRLVSACLSPPSSSCLLKCPPCLPLEYHWRWSLAPWSCQRRAGSPHHHGETSVAHQNTTQNKRPQQKHVCTEAPMDAIANVGAKYHHTSPIQLGECRNHGFLHRSDQSDNLTIKIGMISSLQFANNNNDDIFKPVCMASSGHRTSELPPPSSTSCIISKESSFRPFTTGKSPMQLWHH